MAICPHSVSETVDAVHAAQFAGHPLPEAERQAVARWIAARQGLSGAYADTFAGFDEERKRGIAVFTGERMTSASARHILGEECCRALRLLNVSDPAVARALEQADQALAACLARAAQDPRHTNPGQFCCGNCTVGLWRNLLSGGLDRQPERLARGVEALRQHRDSGAKWRRFPFWYTVLALVDMQTDSADDELRHAAPALERAAVRAPALHPAAQRRHELARRALARL